MREAQRRIQARATANAPVDTRLGLASFLLRKAPDYESFVGCLQVTDKSGRRGPFRLNRAQLRYVRSRTQRDVLLKARQQGFTTEALARDLWHWLTHPGANVLVVCQSIDGHTALKDVTAKFRALLESLRAQVDDLDLITESSTDFVLSNGHTIRFIEAGASKTAAEKKGRAGTITRLHCTELAYWEYAGETLNAMLECVPGVESGSEIEFESTANGAAPDVPRHERDMKNAAGAAIFHWFYADAVEGRNGFRAHFFPWHETEEYRTAIDESDGDLDPIDDEERRLDAIGVTAEQRKWRRDKIAIKGTDTFDQEYPKDDATCFLLSGRTFFDKAAVARLYLGAADPIEILPFRTEGAVGELRIFEHPVAGERYVVTGDPSEGTGGDEGAATVRDRRTGREMAVLVGQFFPWELARALASLGRVYCSNPRNVEGTAALLVVERNNHGGTVLRALHAEQSYPNIFVDLDGKPGWVTTEPSRANALDTLQAVVRNGDWKTKCKRVLAQFRTFVITDKGRAEASRGAHDDLVMAEAICWDVLCRVPVERDLSNLPPG